MTDERAEGDPSDAEDSDPLEGFDLESGEATAPRPDDPTPSPPEPPSPDVDYADVDPDLKTMFWKLVLLYKAAILGLAIGALLVVFDAGVNGGPIFAGALVLLVYTLYLTKRSKQRLDAGEFDTGDTAEGDS